MFRAAVRSTPRALRQSVASTAGRRFASTAPADKKYSWKGTATRWGLAIGALYWYNTSPIFADELPSHLSHEPPQFSEADAPTVDAIVAEKRKQLDERLKTKQEPDTKDKPTSRPAPDTPAATTSVATPENAEKSPEQLEEEAGQQGAFNPETGEINWDCPCLGGMAHGPCGEEFKAAFSCFVYSNEEPKGMDCIDKFQHMQDCFRKYPDVYAQELADEEAAESETEAEAGAAGSPAPAADTRDTPAKDAGPATSAKSDGPAQDSKSTHEYTTEDTKAGPTDAPKGSHPVHTSAATQGAGDTASQETKVDERGVPTKAFDATSSNSK